MHRGESGRGFKGGTDLTCWSSNKGGGVEHELIVSNNQDLMTNDLCCFSAGTPQVSLEYSLE